MIYIKDYRLVQAPVHHEQNAIRSILASLIGRNITVFVDNGNACGGRFTGILIEVLSDHIKLVTRSPQMPRSKTHNLHNKSGANSFISFNHITAFFYHE